MLHSSLPFTGELIALGVAFLWGVAAIIWTAAGERISAMELNLTKSVAALGLVSISILLTRNAFVPIPKLDLFLMLLSGVVGIGLGDVAMFAAFQKIGPTRTSMIKLLSPLLVSLGAFLSLSEKLAPVDFVGMAVTILGIFLVVSERLPNNQLTPGQFWAGVGLAFVATLAEVAQVVLSHQVLVQTQLDPLWGTCLRLAAAAVFLLLWAALTRQRIGGWLHLPESGRLIKLVSTGVFLGTFIGLWLQQVALKISPAGIAQTFFSSMPLFILLIQSLMQRHLPSPRALGGVLISLVGTMLLFLGG